MTLPVFLLQAYGIHLDGNPNDHVASVDATSKGIQEYQERV
jgi:hypothetical protein